MVLAVNASVGLKWVLQEAGSDPAERLAPAAVGLVMPDFWLNEATSALWLRVRRNLLAPDDARQGLMLLRQIVRPTPTSDMGLHDVALDIGMTIGEVALLFRGSG